MQKNKLGIALMAAATAATAGLGTFLRRELLPLPVPTGNCGYFASN